MNLALESASSTSLEALECTYRRASVESLRIDTESGTGNSEQITERDLRRADNPLVHFIVLVKRLRERGSFRTKQERRPFRFQAREPSSARDDSHSFLFRVSQFGTLSTVNFKKRIKVFNFSRFVSFPFF